MHVVRKAAVPVTRKAILGSNFEPYQGQFPSQTPHNVVNRYLDLIEAIPASNTEYHLLKPSSQSEVEICGNKAIRHSNLVETRIAGGVSSPYTDKPKVFAFSVKQSKRFLLPFKKRILLDGGFLGG